MTRLMLRFLCTLSVLGSVAKWTTLVAADSMSMPDDPVSGEMVMSTAYNFNLKNGQRLRFATKETLDQFLHDPKTGLEGVQSLESTTTTAATTSMMEMKMKTTTSDESVLCPVCGMEASTQEGPEVVMHHGSQAIHTCSMFHAHQVYDNILEFRDTSKKHDASTSTPTEDDNAFCTGSGTTMLNGFSFFQGGTPCVLLWFPGWVLSTRWLYVFGCALVCLCAVFNEYLLHVRRVLRKESSLKRLRNVPLTYSTNQGTTPDYNNANPLSSSEMTQLLRSSSLSPMSSSACCPAWFRTLSPEMQHTIHSLLHGLTILVAYMLMLISMTYDGFLFVSVVIGYIVGYYIFGERRDAAAIDTVNFPSNF